MGNFYFDHVLTKNEADAKKQECADAIHEANRYKFPGYKHICIEYAKQYEAVLRQEGGNDFYVQRF